MTDWNLNISYWGGMVPGARHYQGEVTGPHPRSCHGHIHYNAPGAKAWKTCDEGHEIPGQARWTVEEPWDKARYRRYADGGFEGQGPGQFDDQKRLIEVAIGMFTGEIEVRAWQARGIEINPGDRLILGEGIYSPEYIDENDKPDGIHAWGSILAEIPAAKTEEAAR